MKGKLKQSMSRDPVLRRAAISWARQGELTPQRLWPVLRALGGVEALLSTSEEELTKRVESGTRALAVLRSAEDVSSEKWVMQLERAGVRVVTAFDEEYPDALAEISDPPFLLFAAGNLERLRLPAVGIVGSRAATRYGRDVAARLARELSAAGITIVSGFARGVDESAHQAALGAPGGAFFRGRVGRPPENPRRGRGRWLRFPAKPGGSGRGSARKKTPRPRTSRRRRTFPPRPCSPRSSSSRRLAWPFSAMMAATEP